MLRLSSALAIAALGAIALFALAACGGDTSESGENLGVEGASCLRTPDCRAPLQCIGNVCRSQGGGGSGSDTALPTSDVWSFSDAGPPLVGTDATVGADTKVGDSAAETPRDVGPRHETNPNPLEDAYVPFDVGPDWTPSGPDTHVVAPDTYEGCGDLGISSAWSGGFDGQILFWNVEAPPGFEGQVPDSGTLEVYGDLSFEIRCLEQKLIVIGTLRGFGEAVGEMGSHPFEADLKGEYNPLDDTITATIDGSVKLFFVFEIFFEGDFDGALQGNGEFDGSWDGAATGNNLNLEGEARGGGDWWATGD